MNNLERISQSVQERFAAQKRVLSMNEYLNLFMEDPGRYTRDASRYLRDCFDYFGSYEVERPWGSIRRWKLFDQAFQVDEHGSKSRRNDYLVGQETIQEEVYRVLGNFAREGRPNRLILLHGPNGSSKTTFATCLMRALEHYSSQDHGALYRFSWIFPRGKDGRGIGFDVGSARPPKPGDSYAHLSEDEIDAKLPSEAREHPLQLLPLQERRELVARVFRDKRVDEPPGDWIWNGELGHKNQQIFQALLTAYRGDLERVLAHVQVERYNISRRYRVGAVTIGPQMAVDAHERQITADRSLGALPASLSALTLYETFGELVNASGGIVEYSDLLKRPLDAWRYLLLAIENGDIPLSMSNLALNAVLIASSNEVHLAAFKEHHEFNSFRGRIHFVRVPYLLDYIQEQGIYDSQIASHLDRHVAPHATYVAALWAVLTRLRRSKADRFEIPALGRIAADLTPLEKAELYAHGKIPARLSSDEAKEARKGIRDIYEESQHISPYEGLLGGSPREVRAMLLDAAQDATFAYLSPLAVLDRLENFCLRDDYDFLKQEVDHGYHDHRGFVNQVLQRWLDRVEDELRICTGLVEESKYTELFDRYVTHVSFWVKKERLYNRMTGKYEDADVEFMASTEGMLEIQGNAEEFRRNLISVVAGHAIDHPGEKIDYGRVFPRYLELLKSAYFKERKKQISTVARDMLVWCENKDSLEPERAAKAEETVAAMKTRFGYQDASARDAIGKLIQERYTT